MEDEKEATAADKPGSSGTDSARKSRNLKDATAHLKEEALRRYKDKIKGDNEDESKANEGEANTSVEAGVDDTQYVADAVPSVNDTPSTGIKPAPEESVTEVNNENAATRPAPSTNAEGGADGGRTASVADGLQASTHDQQEGHIVPAPPSVPRPEVSSGRGSRSGTPKQNPTSSSVPPETSDVKTGDDEQAAVHGTEPTSLSGVANASSKPVKEVTAENTDNNATEPTNGDEQSTNEATENPATDEEPAQQPAEQTEAGEVAQNQPVEIPSDEPSDEVSPPINAGQNDGDDAPQTEDKPTTEATSGDNVDQQQVDASDSTKTETEGDNVTQATTDEAVNPEAAESAPEQSESQEGKNSNQEKVDGSDDTVAAEAASEPVVKSEGEVKGEEGTEVKGEDGAEVKPEEGTEVKPEEGAEVKAEEGAEVKPEEGAEVKPEEGAEVKPEEGADIKPEEGAEVKAEDGAVEVTSEKEVKPETESTNESVAQDTPQVPGESVAQETPKASGESVAQETAEVSGESSESVQEQSEATDESNVSVAQEQAEVKETAAPADQSTEPGAEEKPEGPVDGQDPNIRGDEFEIQSDEVRNDDDESKIPSNFFYDFADHVSKPTITEESGLPPDMLALNHSFGYDCEKRSNLHLLDQNTIMFAAGNIVEIVNIQTKEQIHIRSTSDGGVGAVAVHPSRKYIAVAEKGTAPNINIYTWPALKLYRILRGGTQEAYAYVDFSPDGEFLSSVGSDPDYMLTLWNWRQEQTVLRSKAFSQDVFRVSFSAELEGQLTSSGTGHIRFWKMADTFTGLKLQGQLGKFGKTEISDIEGYVELPDGKVLSGTEWGNMLLWDGGLIKVEICRKGRKNCHHGPIQQIVMDEGELMTIGEDGFIRVWDFETIDTADTTDEEALFEMEAMNELKVGHGHEVRLRGIVKCVDSDEPTIWFAQDMNGGIWKLDLSFSHTSQVPEKVMTYHAGAISGCSASPVSDLVATIGADSIVRVFDYITQQPLCHYGFNAGGSCILWAPQIVDTKGGTIVCGFEDGVVRVLLLAKKESTDKKAKDKEESELLLGQVLKPHTKRVTAMALDNKGEILATGSEDNTIFFLSVADGMFEPIGFINIPGPVSQMTWSPGEFEKTTLLVTCQNGMVLEIDAPEPGTYNTEHSYLITGLKVKTHQFKSVKSTLRHEEELERKRLEEEEKKRQKERERQKLIDRGIDPPEEEEEEEEKPEEEEWKAFIPSEPSPIHFGFYSKEPGTFWLSMGDFDAGYLYECKFLEDSEKASVPSDQLYEPIRTVPVADSKDVPIVQVHFDKSHDGHQMIMGMEDGAIRIQPLEDSQDLSTLGAFWSLHMHDNHYGKINQIATSYDGKYLFTVGNDGNFFSYHYMGQREIEEKTEVNKAKIPSAKKLVTEEDFKVDDIDDPSHYSIEDAKQKAEYDKMMKLAEEKKQGVRRTIAQLRRQFKKLVVKNEELPPHLQILKKEFEMDPEIKKELDKQTHNKIDLVRKEMAWDAEKHRIQLEKLRNRFKAVVECERIVVRSFESPHVVSSFRSAKLSESFYKFKADMERRKTLSTFKETSMDSSTGLLIGEKSGDSMKTGALKGEDTQANIKTTLKGSMGERITKALEKVEGKRRKRAARKAEWDHLYTNKPDDDYEDPSDVAAIKEAQDNMGDFKLKTAEDYVVPDHLRMNVEKARFKLMILKDLIHEHKYSFNQKLLKIRDKKIKIINEIREAVLQLKQCQAKLGPEKSKPIPSVPHLHHDEVPEKKMEYTRDSLLVFKEQYEKKLLAEKMGNADADAGGGGAFGGFGGGGGGGGATNAPSSKQSVPSTQRSSKLSGTISSSTHRKHNKMQPKSPSGGHSATHMESQGELESYNELLEDESTLSELELRIRTADEIRLLFKRDSLLTRISNLLKTFDAELRVLGHEKSKCAIELKNADLRHVTLFEELMLLKEYEKHENVLAEKLETKQREKVEMQNKVVECNEKVSAKKKEIEKLLEKEKALDATFIASLGDNNKFPEYLMKVFKKKIKRKKAKTTEDGGSDEDSDEDSSDDDSDWDEDEESDSEGGGFDLDICPAGCDQAIYDSTCQLREKRLDIEEALAEEKKNRDQLNKDGENLQKKAKVIQAALKTAEADLEAFQLEKQQKLNELDIVVTHKLNQIQHIVNGVLPQDLSTCLVFELPDVTRLQHRIKELEQEKSLQKKQQKDSKKKHVNLIKDRKLFLAKIDEMNEQCDEAMIGKFGRIVDLEKLEQVTVNRNIEELKEKLRINEVLCSEEIIDWEKKISKTKDDITSLTRQNTERLEMLNMLASERKVLQGTLDARQKHLGGEYSGARKADLHERQRLVQLVQLQAQEVEALKEEIMLLSRKGGHILPPAQPPLPPQHQPISSGH